MKDPGIQDERRTLRVLGELALALAAGQTPDSQWLHEQLTAHQPEQSRPARASELLTIPETCARLRISRWSLYRLIQRHDVETVTIGRRRLVPHAEVERFIAGLRTGGAER